jgi:hypothetical protein
VGVVLSLPASETPEEQQPLEQFEEDANEVELDLEGAESRRHGGYGGGWGRRSYGGGYGEKSEQLLK